MKAVVQRVTSASVVAEGKTLGKIGQGLVVLVAAGKDDTEKEVARMADRILKLRIFNNHDEKMNLALADLSPAGELLVISNFTVYGETARNRRPSFTASAPYAQGKALFEELLAVLGESGLNVETGEFGANMQVSLVNDGPVTVILES